MTTRQIASMLAFRGVDRHGHGHVGRTTDAPAPFAEERFQAGWRSLTILRGAEEVGGIASVAGRRTWWAEVSR